MTGPLEPNGLKIDSSIGRHYGDQLELERSHSLAGQPGKLRILAWRTRARVASFQDATEWLQANPGNYTQPTALIQARNTDKIKYGIGINAEQALDSNSGVFLRAMRADGRTETHAFTEVDGSFAAGWVVQGASWGRGNDSLGVVLMRNTISSERQRFLSAGGISFFIGDGKLNYRPEQIVEVYYSLGVGRSSWITADVQRLRNPAYNADRGPVNVYALRLHSEF
jgi:carbohydrate-selective porin OprB